MEEDIIGIKIRCTIDNKELPSRKAAKRYVRETYGIKSRVHRKHPKRFLMEDRIARESWMKKISAIFQRKEQDRKAAQEAAKSMLGGR
jgi:hypothetical protein